MGEDPGKKRPLFPALFTRTFTLNGISRGGSKPPGALRAAVSRLLAPVKAGEEVFEHTATIRGHLGVV